MVNISQFQRGVQKMNSLVDIRQSFFKNRVTSLMSRQSVIKILNKPMNKKKKADEVDISSPQTRKLDNKKQLQLKEKRKQIQMRLAYGAEEHSPDALRKMMAEHTQKQSILESKIEKIMDTHEERLAKRIRQRKLRTLTAKSRSDIYMNEAHDSINGIGNISKKQMMQKKRDEEQFGTIPIIEQKPDKSKDKDRIRKQYRSLSPKKCQIEEQCDSPSKNRRISMDFKYMSLPKQFQLPKQFFKP